MKRFHVHMSVENLDESINFYSKLFSARPAVRHADYAKWMLEDPRLNFAISTRHQPAGVNHLGFQVDSDDELRAMKAQLHAADSRLAQEDEKSCCYAKSNKYWVTDPTGIAWETFHTLGSISVYDNGPSILNSHQSRAGGASQTSSCGAPAAKVEPAFTSSGCCAG